MYEVRHTDETHISYGSMSGSECIYALSTVYQTFLFGLYAGSAISCAFTTLDTFGIEYCTQSLAAQLVSSIGLGVFLLLSVVARCKQRGPTGDKPLCLLRFIGRVVLIMYFGIMSFILSSGQLFLWMYVALEIVRVVVEIFEFVQAFPLSAIDLDEGSEMMDGIVRAEERIQKPFILEAAQIWAQIAPEHSEVNDVTIFACPICLEKFALPQKSVTEELSQSITLVLELENCEHKFHDACIQQWYSSSGQKRSHRCPLCQTRIARTILV